MNSQKAVVNRGYGSLAPVRNVAECLGVAQSIIDRPAGVDGLGVFFGPSGYGKSKASQFVQNKFRALYIEVFEYWTRKKFCQSLLAELGVDKPRGSIADMMDQILLRLQDDPNRLLIVDEADKLVDKGMIELVRDLYKGARIPVLLVGEERLPDKLKAYERCENRVSAYGMAMPCDLEDVRALAKIYQRQLDIGDDLLEHIRAQTAGVASRVVTTLAEIGQWAKSRQLTVVRHADYDGAIFTGRAPQRGR